MMKLPASRLGSMKRFSYPVSYVRVACSVVQHIGWLNSIRTISVSAVDSVSLKSFLYRSGEEPEDTRHQT